MESEILRAPDKYSSLNMQIRAAASRRSGGKGHQIKEYISSSSSDFGAHPAAMGRSYFAETRKTHNKRPCAAVCLANAHFIAVKLCEMITSSGGHLK